MLRRIIYFSFLLIILLLSKKVFGQFGPPDPDPVDIPIDGGIIILLTAGLGYGIKKLKKNKS